MAASTIGESTVMVFQGKRVDPLTNAVTFEQQYDGTDSAITTLANTLVLQGARTSVENIGGVNRLTAQWNRDPDILPAAEEASDIWDDDTITEEIDLFSLPAAVAEAAGYVSTAQYRTDITDAVEAGEAFPLDSTSYPVGAQIYNLLARGVKAVPVNRPVLTRNRTFSASYESRNQMEYRQRVWTTSALISAFSIPSAVQDRFPDDPSAAETPEGTRWGWKLTVDRSSYNTGTGKITEVKSWTFGAWVEEFFTFVT